MLGEVKAIDAQQEAAMLFRASLRLFEKWGVTDEQAAILLDLLLRTYRRWKEQGAGKPSGAFIDCNRMYEIALANDAAQHLPPPTR